MNLKVFFFEKGYHRIEVSDGLTLLHSSGAGIGRVNQNERKLKFFLFKLYRKSMGCS